MDLEKNTGSAITVAIAAAVLGVYGQQKMNAYKKLLKLLNRILSLEYMIIHN